MTDSTLHSSQDSDSTTLESIFGPVIHSYTRAQAIADGVLVDVSEVGKEAGFKIPVAVTDAVWQDCVAWSDEDSSRQTYQDQSGRLWDVVYMASDAIRRARTGDASELLYQLYRVPRDGRTKQARLVQLKVVIGPGDSGEAVVTIMEPHED